MPVCLCQVDPENIDLQGLETAQLFLHTTATGEPPQSFEDCSTDRAASAFAGALHAQITARLRKSFENKPAVKPVPDSPPVESTLCNLPRLTHFFGRKKELEVIAKALLPQTRTWGVLIDGPGGMGKTSLAVKAAELARADFDRVLFVSTKNQKLTPEGTVAVSNSIVPAYPELLSQTARLLGLAHATDKPEAERAALIKAAMEKEKVLLIFDNLENLALHTSTEEVMAWAQAVTDVATILPIVRIEDGRLLRHRDRHGAGERRGGRDVRPAENAVPVDVRMDDGGDPGIDKAPREVFHVKFRGFCPAFRGDLATAGIDADGDLAGECLRSFTHQGGILYRDGAEDHPRDACGEPGVDRRHVADAAAELDRHLRCLQNCIDGAGIDGFAGESAVEVDHVNPFRSGIDKALRLIAGGLVEHGRLIHIALDQAHAGPVLQVDGRVEDHGDHARKAWMKARPTAWLFSG